MWKDNLLTVGALLVLIIHPSQSFIDGVCNGVKANDQVCQRPEKGNKYNDILIQAKENNLKNNIGLTETRVILSRYHLGTENSRIYRERSSKDSSGIRELDQRQTSRAPTTSARNSRYMISLDGQTQRQINSQTQSVTQNPDLTYTRIDMQHSSHVHLPEVRTERANINNIRFQKNEERFFSIKQLRRNNERESFIERPFTTRDIRQYDSFSERKSPEKRENNILSKDRNQRVNLSNRRETREISHTNRRNDRMNYRNNRKNIDYNESNRQTMSFRQKSDEQTLNQRDLLDRTSNLRSGDRHVNNALNGRREVQIDRIRKPFERDITRTIRNKRYIRTTENPNSENNMNSRMNGNEKVSEKNRNIRVLRNRDNSGIRLIDNSDRRSDLPKQHDSRNDLIQDRNGMVRERQLTRNTRLEQRKNIDMPSRRSVDVLTVRRENKRQEDTERRHINERRNNLLSRNQNDATIRRFAEMRLDRKSENRLQNTESRNLRTRRDDTMRRFTIMRFDRENQLQNQEFRNIRTDETRKSRENTLQRFAELRSDREVENLETRNRRVNESRNQRDNTMRRFSKANRNLYDQRIDEIRNLRDNTMQRFTDVRSDREARLRNSEFRNSRVDESKIMRDNTMRRFSKVRSNRDSENKPQNRESNDRRIDETRNRRDNTIQRFSEARSARDIGIRLQNREYRIQRDDESSIQRDNTMRRFYKVRSDQDVENRNLNSRRIDDTRNRRDNKMQIFTEVRYNPEEIRNRLVEKSRIQRDNTMRRFSKMRYDRDVENRLQNRESHGRRIDETRNHRDHAMQRFSEMRSDREGIQHHIRDFRNLRVDESINRRENTIRRFSNDRFTSQNRQIQSQKSLIRDSRDRQIPDTMRITPSREVRDRLPNNRMLQKRATSRLVLYRDIGNMQDDETRFADNRLYRQENDIKVRESQRRTQTRDSKTRLSNNRILNMIENKQKLSSDRVLIDARNIISQEMNLDSQMQKSSYDRNSVRKDTANNRSREVTSESRVRALDTSRRAASIEMLSNARLLVRRDANNILSNKLNSRNRFLDAQKAKEHVNDERNIRFDTVRQFHVLSSIPLTLEYDTSTMKLFQGVDSPSMGDIAIQLLKTLSICTILLQIIHSYKDSNPKFGFSKIFKGIGHTLKLKAN